MTFTLSLTGLVDKAGRMRVGEAAAFERNDGIETLGADDPNAIAVLNFIICWNLINMRDNVVDVECKKELFDSAM